LALDAKMGFDDNALFRHSEIEALRDEDEEDPIELEAGKHALNYVKLDGNIGCMVNGAGLAMACASKAPMSNWGASSSVSPASS